MAKRYRRRKAVPQVRPTNQELVLRFESGLESRREISSRVEAGLANKTSEEEKKAFIKLQRAVKSFKTVPQIRPTNRVEERI